MSTSTINTIGSLISFDWYIFIPILALLLPFIMQFLAKEEVYNEKIEELLDRVLNKKVAALGLLIESIQTRSVSLGEAKGFRGKDFFIDINQLFGYERDIISMSKKFSFVISTFYWLIVGALFAFVFLSLNFVLTKIIGGILVVFLFIGSIFGILAIRSTQRKLNSYMKKEDLKHVE